MAERKWTPPQQAAITAKGGSVLVSAAAGSGKTAVLVERAIRLICDGDDPVPADRLLVVTFSNAAAAEMKQRMNARLSSMIGADPSNLHLQRQQAMLQGAQISTVHSFCLELIRQNFQHLDISPDFALSDEQEMEILEQECARDVIEEFYAQEDNALFLELVELMTTGRDDRGLVDAMLRIYRFARSHPFYRHWLQDKLELYNPELPPAETAWGTTVLRYVTDSLTYCKRMMAEALDLTAGDEALEKGYGVPFRADLEAVRTCLEAAEVGDWDGAARQLAAYKPMRLGAVRSDHPAKEQAKALRDRVKKILQGLAEKHLNATSEDFKQDIAALRPLIQVLFALVEAFGDHLWEIKSAKRRLDFSDLEHLALELLVEKEGDGYTRTQLAAEIAGRYSYVMVDEYQDTNEVQDLIFTAVSDNQRNLFMVGDVKQSIYSFRQAMPEIFIRKKQVFFPYETGQYPAKINLDTNFRSRNTVTGGVNFLFSLLMSHEIGEMEYGEEERLKCGAIYPDHPQMEPQFLLLEKDPDASEDTTVQEAAAVAAEIDRMLRQGFPVTGEEGLRPATPADFCILLRSPRGRAEAFVSALTDRGIPAGTDLSGGYLQAREVSAVVCLLKALDNPLLDIELVSALMSPLFDFTDDEIAEIRLTRRGAPFYTALVQAAEENGKCRRFLEVFAQLRTQAALLPADRLLLAIYDATDALSVFRSMHLGETRAANLQLLVEYAAHYHKMGYKRLGGFVGFLGRLEERGGDLAPASNTGHDGGSGAVQVLSIHKSKGLEFPVVILADTFRRFNKVDLRQNTLLHSRYGFACVRRDRETMRQFATVPMQAIRLESERSLLSEELRVLYVALTRAKEKLIVSGICSGKLDNRIQDLSAPLRDGRLPSYVVREGNSYADWMIMSLLHHPIAGRLLTGDPPEAVSNEDAQISWAVTRATAALQVPQAGETQALEHTAKPDLNLLEHLQKRASFVYPHAAQTTIPTKLAVSAVAKGEQSLAYRFSARPKFLTTTGLSATEKGNAMHKFMQFSDYRNAHADLEAEIIRMEQSGFLTPAETTSLSRSRLRQFFDGDLAQRIFSSRKVLRELKFTAECGREVLGDFFEDMDNKSGVVLQGVADCVFYEDAGAVIVDYKTDNVTDPDQLRRMYAKQLQLYRQILTNSLEAPVVQCLLYSFRIGQTIEVL